MRFQPQLTYETVRASDPPRPSKPWRIQLLEQSPADDEPLLAWACSKQYPDQALANHAATLWLRDRQRDLEALRSLRVEIPETLPGQMRAILFHLRPEQIGGRAKCTWEFAWAWWRPGAELTDLSKCCRSAVEWRELRGKPRPHCQACGAADCALKRLPDPADTMAAELPGDVRRILDPASPFYQPAGV